MTVQRDPGLEIAIEEAGGVRALARIVKRSSATVAVWKRIPVAHVFIIEKQLGVMRYELRPDVYPPDEVQHEEKPRTRVTWV